MPILLASGEIDAITQTLDTLMTVDLPRLIILFGLLLIAVIIIIVLAFWRILSNYSRADSQQMQLTAQTMTNLNDYLKTEREINRTKLDLALQEIRESHKVIMGGIAAENKTIEKLLERYSELFNVIDDRLESMRARIVTVEAENKQHWQAMIESNQGLKQDMNDVKDNNSAILTELQTISKEMKRLADLVETAMNNLTETMDKLALHNQVINEPKPDKSSAMESTDTDAQT